VLAALRLLEESRRHLAVGAEIRELLAQMRKPGGRGGSQRIGRKRAAQRRELVVERGLVGARLFGEGGELLLHGRVVVRKKVEENAFHAPEHPRDRGELLVGSSAKIGKIKRRGFLVSRRELFVRRE